MNDIIFDSSPIYMIDACSKLARQHSPFLALRTAALNDCNTALGSDDSKTSVQTFSQEALLCIVLLSYKTILEALRAQYSVIAWDSVILVEPVGLHLKCIWLRDFFLPWV